MDTPAATFSGLRMGSPSPPKTWVLGPTPNPPRRLERSRFWLQNLNFVKHIPLAQWASGSLVKKGFRHRRFQKEIRPWTIS
jgi:hypothetical protein